MFNKFRNNYLLVIEIDFVIMYIQSFLHEDKLTIFYHFYY